METISLPITPILYSCEKCDFHSSNKKDYNRHLMTRKHKMEIDWKTEKPHMYSCSECGKTYANKSGLWKHRKKCPLLMQDIVNKDNLDFKEMFIEAMQQNKELQKTMVTHQQQMSNQQQQISDQQQQIIELIPKVGNTTNHTTNNTTNHNNQFNLNFFLNEQCKDAIPLIDFVKSLQYDFDQLEYTGKHGFVEGVSKIIMDAMNELDITKRPIHCTDVKRETFYVKDDESWKKEGERNRSIKTAIHNIRNRNMACIPEWIRAHPNCKKMDDPNNDLFIEIIGQYMDASETEFNKVIKTIAKSLTIPKSKYGRKLYPL